MTELQRQRTVASTTPTSSTLATLARQYRSQGRIEAAIELCIRALHDDPAHLEGHVLLAQLYLELGDGERAGDEWSIVLRLDPEHFEAHRGLGLYRLELGHHSEARRHLEWAASKRPDDVVTRNALALLDREAAQLTVAPDRALASLLAEPACLGVLILDASGLIHSGGLKEGIRGQADILATLLGGLLEEATRVIALLEPGHSRGVQVETAEALLQLMHVGDGAVLLITAPGTADEALSRLEERAVTIGGRLLGSGL